MLIGVDGFRSIGRHGATITRQFSNLAAAILIVMALSNVKSFTCFCASLNYYPADHSSNNNRRGPSFNESLVSGILPKESPENVQNVVRYIRLRNECSGRYVQQYFEPDLGHNVINARGFYGSPLVRLRVESFSHNGEIRIKFDRLNKYLCFKQNHRLIAKVNGFKNNLCVFVERIADNLYTELQSAYNSSWFLGFNGNGTFLGVERYKGDNGTKPRRTCFQYNKIEEESFVDVFQGPKNGPSAKIIEANHRQRHKQRHSRRQNNKKISNRQFQNGVR